MLALLDSRGHRILGAVEFWGLWKSGGRGILGAVEFWGPWNSRGLCILKKMDGLTRKMERKTLGQSEKPDARPADSNPEKRTDKTPELLTKTTDALTLPCIGKKQERYTILKGLSSFFFLHFFDGDFCF